MIENIENALAIERPSLPASGAGSRSASIPAVHGIVVIDKPAGMTSHDVVGIARKLFRTKRVGHTGTLDPDATGVMVLCLGNGTRLAEYLSAAHKHYVAEFVFGVETASQDASGDILAEHDASHLTETMLRNLLPEFRGTIQQVPPMVSALHYEGQRLYDLARQGIVVEREARTVHIDELELTAFSPGLHPKATLEITCSTGTYIRALAADLGSMAGVGGMMQTLRRTWVGAQLTAVDRPFTLEHAQTLDALRERAQAGTLGEIVLPLTVALAGWPLVRLDAEQTAHIRQGRPLSLADVRAEQCLHWHQVTDAATPPTPIGLLEESGGVVAVAQLQETQLHPHKVFAP